ncbi:Acetyl-coenzyme A synthetase chloroplastic/glyoxysomal [Zea mays]|nr:Acetyl-coenzyme A synthetase chloroplastic/glyoxysomal [Zea mays]
MIYGKASLRRSAVRLVRLLLLTRSIGHLGSLRHEVGRSCEES